MILELSLAERLRGWLAHSREHNQAHTCIPNILIEDMLTILEERQKTYDRNLVERTLEVFERAFEKNWPVQDTIDAIRKVAE